MSALFQRRERSGQVYLDKTGLGYSRLGSCQSERGMKEENDARRPISLSTCVKHRNRGPH